MDESLAARRTDLAYLVLFAVAAAVAMWRLNPAEAPLIVDTQVYYYIAERAASGIPPHVSEFDPKNALSMLATAAAIRLGRGLGLDDVMAARALSMTITCAVFPMLWIVARRLFGSRPAACAAAMTLLLFNDYHSLAVAGSRPKVFLVFCVISWLLVATKRRPLALGAVAACAFLIWQPALLLVPVSIVAAAWAASQRKLREAMLVIAGAAVPIAVYELYFLASGALGQQIYQSLVFPAVYGKQPPDVLDNASRILSLWEGRWSIRPYVMAVYALAMASWWMVAATLPSHAKAWVRGRCDRVCLVLGATAAQGFILLDYQGFPDRLFVLPFVALANAWVASMLHGWLARAPRVRQSTARVPVSLLRAAGVALVAVLAFRWVMTRPYQQYLREGLTEQRQAAAVVGKILARGRSVYAISPLHLLAMNRASNFTYHGFFPQRIRAYMAEKVKEDGKFLPLRDGKLPDVILQSRMQPPGVGPLLRNYKKLRRPRLAAQGVTIHRILPHLPANATKPKSKTPGGH